MKRIGIAASKIAKGNIFLYNFYVILISFLFSLFLFLIVGSTVLFSLFIINYIGSEITDLEFSKDGTFVYSVSMTILSVIMGFFNLFAIFLNLKFRKED